MEEVEAVRRFVYVREQFVERDARQAFVLALDESLAERHVREFGDDVEPVVRDPEIFGGEEVRVPEVLDEFERFEFALRDFLIGGLVENLDGLLDAAGHLLGEPDFAEGPAAEFANEFVLLVDGEQGFAAESAADPSGNTGPTRGPHGSRDLGRIVGSVVLDRRRRNAFAVLGGLGGKPELLAAAFVLRDEGRRFIPGWSEFREAVGIVFERRLFAGFVAMAEFDDGQFDEHREANVAGESFEKLRPIVGRTASQCDVELVGPHRERGPVVSGEWKVGRSHRASSECEYAT